MPHGQGFPLFASGPRSDLEVGYLKFEVGAAGAVTVVPGQTTAGFSISAFSTGVATLTHPKCKFILPLNKEVRPDVLATVANHRTITFSDDWDPTTGSVVFNTREDDTASAVANPVDGSEVVMAFLYGF